MSSVDKEILGMDAKEIPIEATFINPDSWAESHENKTIFRVKKTSRPPYTQVHNAILTDPRLTWEAKGLMAFMLSKPDDWDFNRNEMMKNSADKEWCLKRIIKELKLFGYLKIEPLKDDKGKIVEWITYVFENPSDTQNEPKSYPQTQKVENQPVDLKPVDKSVNNSDKKIDPRVNTGGYPEVGFPTSGETTRSLRLTVTNTSNNKYIYINNNTELESPVVDASVPPVPAVVVDNFGKQLFTKQTQRDKISPHDFKALTDFGYDELSAVDILSEFEGGKVRQAIEYVSNLEKKRPNSVDRPLAYVRAILRKKIEIRPHSVRSVGIQQPVETWKKPDWMEKRLELTPEQEANRKKLLDEVREKLKNLNLGKSKS